MVSFKVYYEANIANAEHLKNEIISLLKTNSRRKPNLEPGGPIYKWFTNNLMKWLTGPATSVSYPFQQSLVGLEPHNYKEGEPEWMAKDDVVDFTDVGDWPKMDHIMDYFNSLSDREREKIVKKPYEQVDKEVAQWDKELAEQEKSSEGRLKKDKDYEVIGKDGEFTWVKLKTKAAYECEGEGMGHCVGGYDPDDSNNTIISLWDKRGQPHVTIEIQEYTNDPYYDSGPPGVDNSGRPGGVGYDLEEIVQIKGKQNEPPADKYKDITARFVKKWLDKGEFNEQAKSIKDLDESRIVRDDGKGIGMIRHEGGDGAWHWYFEDSKIWDKIYKIDVVPIQQAKLQEIKKRMFDDPSIGLLVDADVNLSHGFFEEIPKELAKVRGITDGDLIVNDNRLTSLKNSPTNVEGSVFATDNGLETLEGGPSIVDGDFKVNKNNLKNLKGLPEHISGDLHINMNPLESLKGAENTVVGGTVFVGGWPVEDALAAAQADASTLEQRAPDFMKRDKVIAAFKHIGKGKPTGELWPGKFSDTPGEVQYIPKHVNIYPPRGHPNRPRL